jgi:hypothetical protein
MLVLRHDFFDLLSASALVSETNSPLYAVFVYSPDAPAIPPID